ncbi:MAG: DUF4158 domain-containing protein [Chloroflexota bacterium]
MTAKEQFLSQRKRYQPISLPKEFSDEEMVRDWTLKDDDRKEVNRYRKNSRLFVAIQLCSVRLYGRFLTQVHELSPRIITYLNTQLQLAPTLTVTVPEREATYLEQRKNTLTYLGFRKFDEDIQDQLSVWLSEQAKQGSLPEQLFSRAEQYLLSNHVLLPGRTVLERLIIHITAQAHTDIFASIYDHLSPELRQAIDKLL